MILVWVLVSTLGCMVVNIMGAVFCFWVVVVMDVGNETGVAVVEVTGA